MERAGREALEAALGTGAFSGEYVSARVAEGVLLCEDVLAVPPVPVEVLVRSEALRDRRNCEPRSVTELAMLCRLACLRFCGVACTLEGNSYWSRAGGGVSSSVLGAGGILSVGGVVEAARVADDAEGLCPLDLPPKNEGRREKRPCEAGVVEVAVVLVMLLVGSAMVEGSQRSGALPSDQGVFHVTARHSSARPAGAVTAGCLRWQGDGCGRGRDRALAGEVVMGALEVVDVTEVMEGSRCRGLEAAETWALQRLQTLL